MRKPICVILAVICIANGSTVSAQAPTFAPYGAWRGRIRYVEGPWRTRSTIRWGNGITPTGGQVVMHGLTSAENILTDPEVLKKLMSGGQRDAESIAKAEANNAAIHTAILELRIRNQANASMKPQLL